MTMTALHLVYFHCHSVNTDPCRGCITPKVIENLINSLEGRDLDGDLDIIDGYEDLPEEWKGKVRTMLKEGHVPDEDWKGVSDTIYTEAQSLALNTNSGRRAKPTRQERLPQEGYISQEKGQK